MTWIFLKLLNKKKKHSTGTFPKDYSILGRGGDKFTLTVKLPVYISIVK